MLLIVLAIASLAACGGGGGNKVGDFPLTYKPLYSLDDVKTEDNPNGAYMLGYNSPVYDPNAETVIEYCKASDELYILLNGSTGWPAELNDEWKGYGYTAIVNTDEASIRTLAVGQYGAKQATVLRQHMGWLEDYGFRVSQEALTWPKDESLRTVTYCMLETDKEVTIEEIASAAYEALFIQAWTLVPAANQGVLIKANGETYLVSDIIKELGNK